MKPVRVKNPNNCAQCGACETECRDSCTACGKCLSRCPRGLLRISGKWWDAEALASRVLRNKAMLLEGGVTVSGGEALMQPDFTIELMDRLAPLHRAVETSGYGSNEKWSELLKRLELVYYDIKLADAEKHRFYTGASNEMILENLETLKASGVPFVIRIPTISGVNDDEGNMLATAKLLHGCETLQSVELLPYNEYAGSKYPLVGKTYKYSFTKPSVETLERCRDIFRSEGLLCIIR